MGSILPVQGCRGKREREEEGERESLGGPVVWTVVWHIFSCCFWRHFRVGWLSVPSLGLSLHALLFPFPTSPIPLFLSVFSFLFLANFYFCLPPIDFINLSLICILQSLLVLLILLLAASKNCRIISTHLEANELTKEGCVPLPAYSSSWWLSSVSSIRLLDLCQTLTNLAALVFE